MAISKESGWSTIEFWGSRFVRQTQIWQTYAVLGFFDFLQAECNGTSLQNCTCSVTQTALRRKSYVLLDWEEAWRNYWVGVSVKICVTSCFVFWLPSFIKLWKCNEGERGREREGDMMRYVYHIISWIFCSFLEQLGRYHHPFATLARIEHTLSLRLTAGDGEKHIRLAEQPSDAGPWIKKLCESGRLVIYTYIYIYIYVCVCIYP